MKQRCFNRCATFISSKYMIYMTIGKNGDNFSLSLGFYLPLFLNFIIIIIIINIIIYCCQGYYWGLVHQTCIKNPLLLVTI